MNNTYISTSALYGPYLAHYGIKGQKWGIRRYQNPDGTLTAEGAKRYGYGDIKRMKKAAIAEYKADNNKAFELGRQATIDAHAAQIAKNKLIKLRQKASKMDSNTKKGHKVSEKARDEYYNWMVLDSRAHKSERQMKEHYDSLVKKYGNRAIKDIQRDKNGLLNEFILTNKQMMTYNALLSPIFTATMMSPSTAGQRAYNEYVRGVKRQEKEVVKALRSSLNE